MSNQTWEENRAVLERELLDAKATVKRYQAELPLNRTVTDSEYKLARQRMTESASAIANGDYEANKPVNPLDDMSLDELKAHYQEKRDAYAKIGSRDTRKSAELMGINTRIQAMEAEILSEGDSE